MQQTPSIAPRSMSQNIGQIEIPYVVYETEGPPLVFLHATGFLPWIWHPIARELAPPYRVFAPYFCDHRTSAPEDGGLGWQVLAEDFAGLCRALSLERPFLVGHSMGATVLALANALFGLDARGMVLIEPIFLPEDFYKLPITVEQHPLAAKSIKRRNRWADEDEAKAYLRSRSLFQEWDPEMLEIYSRYGLKAGDGGGLQLTCSPEREAALFMGGLQHNPWPEAAKTSCPVLVLEGEKSDNRAFIDLSQVAALFPRGSYRLIAEAGHLIPMEQPRVVMEAIRDFFNEQ